MVPCFPAATCVSPRLTSPPASHINVSRLGRCVDVARPRRLARGSPATERRATSARDVQGGRPSRWGPRHSQGKVPGSRTPPSRPRRHFSLSLARVPSSPVDKRRYNADRHRARRAGGWLGAFRSFRLSRFWAGPSATPLSRAVVAPQEQGSRNASGHHGYCTICTRK